MGSPVTLMIIDVPNVTKSLFSEGYPTKPEWNSLKEWAAARAAVHSSRLECIAFLNMPIPTEVQERWTRRKQIGSLERCGIEVHVNYKATGTPDVDQDMLITLNEFRWDHELTEVIIVSHDMRNFANAITQLEVLGIRCTIVGFKWQMGRRNEFGSGIEHTFVPFRAIDGFLQKSKIPVKEIKRQRNMG